MVEIKRENECGPESFDVELSLQEFTDILSAGFEDGISRAMVKNMVNNRILHPRKDPRTYKQTLTAKDLLKGYMAMIHKREAGYEQWNFVASLMTNETLKNGEEVRSTSGWLRIATAALTHRKNIDFDEYPDLSPIINEVIIPAGNLETVFIKDVRSSDEYLKYAWLLKRMGVYIYSYKKLVPIIRSKH